MTGTVTDYATVQTTIREHVSKSWPGHPLEAFAWMQGPISRALPHFRVLRVQAAHMNEPWVYISCGVWASETKADHRFEFAIFSPTESPVHVETLAMLANYHADEQHVLSPGDVVQIGRPWMDGGTCDWLLVSLPYPFPIGFEHLAVPDTTMRIRFLWLVPITDDEAAFTKQYGVEALESQFEAAGINYLNPSRRSVLASTA